jgi:dTDP-4-dehydrorhamnose 3,5-epimerase
MKKEIEFLEGGIAVDDRGKLVFCNQFNMATTQRFYMVSNHRSNFIRAWHAHKNESKYVFIVQGSALLAGVKIDNWDKPTKDLRVEKFVISDFKPGILYIPEGYAHGYKTLTPNSKIIFFSTTTLDQSSEDDYRYDAYYWNPWDVQER